MTKFEKQRAGLVSLLIATSLIGWDPLFKTFALSWRNDEYTYILLILPFSLALFFLDRNTREVVYEWDPRVGVSLLLAAAALAVTPRLLSSAPAADVRLAIDMLAIVLSWVGSFVLCFGRRAARRVLFPLLFLSGLVPLPDVAMNCIVAFLQEGSAWSAHALFVVFRVPVFQQGVLLTIPNLTIQVAQECSSIRSSTLLLVTAIISAKVLLRSPWRRILIVALAIPLSVVKNGLRIFAIAMLGTRVDAGYLTGSFHRHGGILFFLAALAGIFAAIAVARRHENLQASWNSLRRAT
ncbi:MAG: exosortase/archaeosortase family protein [Terracidiphilus sp.]